MSRASTPLGASLTVDLEGAALSPAGEVPSGAIITIDASRTKKGRFDAWTVFTVGGASAKVHTSCSQPLYVGQLLELGDGAGALVITSVQTDAASISETANSTTCTVVASPPASPPLPPAPISVTEGCFICSKEVNYGAKLSTLTVRPRPLPCYCHAPPLPRSSCPLHAPTFAPYTPSTHPPHTLHTPSTHPHTSLSPHPLPPPPHPSHPHTALPTSLHPRADAVGVRGHTSRLRRHLDRSRGDQVITHHAGARPGYNTVPPPTRLSCWASTGTSHNHWRHAPVWGIYTTPLCKLQE